MANSVPNNGRRGSFLPDFCALPMVFGVVVLSELFAFVLVLARSPLEQFWDDLALVSLFMQWAGLSGAAILCLLRGPLSRMSDIGAATISYLLLLVLVLVLSEAAYRLLLQGLAETAVDHAEFIGRNLAIGAIVAGIILRYFYMGQQWRLQVRAESEARVQALQARIRPHFLFNSLNTAASLAHDRPDLAEGALEDLADLFRASLGDERELVPIYDEFELTRNYLAVERLRLGDRLTVEWQVEAVPDNLEVPPLILQPLVENAVYHGIEPRPDGGSIRIRGRRDRGVIEIEVSNPEADGGSRRSTGNRMAVENIRQRLAARYGPEADLSVVRDSGEYRVRVRIPERRRL